MNLLPHASFYSIISRLFFTDGEEVSGTIPEEWADTQEEEFESEEQWRKQRHEREMFLRQMVKYVLKYF